MIYPIIQPESLGTINIIPGPSLYNFPALIILGALLLVVAIIIFFRRSHRRNKVFIWTALVFWLPLFVILSLNNIEDFGNNLEYLKYSTTEKRMARLCLASRKNPFFCNIEPLVNSLKPIIPTGSKIKIISKPDLKNYISYLSYPYFEEVLTYEKTEYILFYLPNELFYYQNEELFIDEGGRAVKIGDYSPVPLPKFKDALILKKKN